MKPNLSKKKILIVCLAAFITAASVFTYSHFQKKKQEQEIKVLLSRLTEAANLMDSVKEAMPQELLEVHEFLVQLNQENKFKLYQIHPKLKRRLIMYHGVKTKGIYVDPSVNLRAEIWIPIFYHEAGHLYWHSKYPVETFEEFQEKLLASEEHSLIVQAQAWNIVKEHFPTREESLSSLELKLFNIYERDTSLYNRVVEGDAEAKAELDKIIEEDIRVQREQQELLK